MKLHHIGLVVSNIENSLGELTQFIKFFDISKSTTIDSQKVNVCFLKMGDCYLELIEPLEDDSPIKDFSLKGGGIHHLCFEVDDIHQTISEMEKKGAKVIVNPVKGFEDRLIAFLFLNMKNTSCNLIELATVKK
jgi:methylmalonyl-CoA/ethylmalonyl-CoA epimerase